VGYDRFLNSIRMKNCIKAAEISKIKPITFMPFGEYFCFIGLVNDCERLSGSFSTSCCSSCQIISNPVLFPNSVICTETGPQRFLQLRTRFFITTGSPQRFLQLQDSGSSITTGSSAISSTSDSGSSITAGSSTISSTSGFFGYGWKNLGFNTV
jgi:hypothetical protein